MTDFLIALQFLTRLPVRLAGMPAAEQLGRSLLWYPVVGVLLGGALLLLDRLLDGAPPLLHAGLLLAFWAFASGALHLDGLADTADAWVGGLGDRERTLAIMKDPRSGPIAVVVLVIVLLLKFAALAALSDGGQWAALLLAPVLGRTALLALFLSTPYVRPGGLGQALADHLPRQRGWSVLGVAAGGCLLLGWSGLLALLAAVAVFGLARQGLMARVGGTTGDTAGALLELVECGVLVVVALS
ncbi:adenosylcobinamide-GDP ribazoletransferase [Pseudomonas sp. PIC25]|uniref:adenosylcobinamide-GDP ribazoletransferase n=1 Tax=Pseudomonas sp. PIC25 TaxID=1958773 RepID=UPI000BAB6951|nr:adenosylcobinamide-GDP ribazoletransferase [Pseudomonas sp. PIC25]PAU51238.1 adenosylcobinamide-GDP ribazoletransferase [Pseudomonas sp. PIC25]